MRFKSRSRALVASALAASLGLAGLTLAASPAAAVEDTEIIRVAGATRYGTAAAAADRAYPDGATNVVLASGEDFPDALSAGGFAGTLDAPILLTPHAELDDATLSGLESLGAENVYVMGGTAAVSETVVDALEEEGYTVIRVAGDDRFETAAETAAEIGGTTAVLANGFSYADALAISPAAHSLELPILLTNANDMPAVTETALDGADTVIIVGGTAVVSQEIEDALEADGKTVTRLAGETRYESAIEIAEFHFENGFDADELVMATGEDFADALAGGPLASQLNAPLVLTQTNVLTPSTADFLESIAPELDTIYILGGTAAIAESVAQAAAEAAQADTNQAFGITPADAQTVAEGESVQYTVTGVDGPVDILLLPCDAATVSDSGAVTFDDADGDGYFEEGEAGSADFFEGEIDVVNGVAAADGAQAVENVSPTDAGTITFTVSSDQFGCSVPLVIDLSDADYDAGRIPVDESGSPTGDFALGGAANYEPAAAPAGDYSGQGIDQIMVFSVNAAENTFVGCLEDTVDNGDGNPECYTFTYGTEGSTYMYGGQFDGYPISLASFEAYLSGLVPGNVETYDNGAALGMAYGGDILRVSYGGATEPSSIHIGGDVPNAPTGVNATFVSANAADETPAGVAVTWTAPVNPNIVNPDCGNSQDPYYNVYRAVADDEGEFGDYTLLASVGEGVVGDDTDECEAPPTEYFDASAAEDTTYRYVVQSVADGYGAGTNWDYPLYSAFSMPASVTTPLEADTTDVTITDLRVATDTGSGGVADGTMSTGDQLRFVFDDAVVVPAGATFTFSDEDGSVGEITCGTNATCQVSASGTTLLVTLTGAPLPLEFGDPLGVQYPAYLEESTGVQDDAGNDLDLEASGDRVAETEEVAV